MQDINKTGQSALEYTLTYGWMIFIILLALGVLGFYFSAHLNYAYMLSDSIKSTISVISGFALFSQEEIEVPLQVSQNSYMEIIISPTSKGIYKFAYIYDSEDNLKQVFSFDCEDICKEKKTARVFINDSYSLGNYVAVFSYESEKYIKKEFEVISFGLPEECTLKRAYWEKQEAGNNENVNLILESENCENKKAVFSIYKKNIFGDRFIENISAIISGEQTRVSWNAKWKNSALIPFLWKSNPVYSFKVRVNPELESENELVVSDRALSGETGINEGWVSWGKDSENSRIADYNLTPPFRVKWMKNSPSPCAYHPVFLARDGKVFSLTSETRCEPPVYKVAYNATTGEVFWTDLAGGAGSGTRQPVIANEYVLSTDSHYHEGGIVIETGLGAPPVVNHDVSNVDTENSIVATQGWCGLDAMSDCFRVFDLSNLAGASPVKDGKFSGAYEFDKSPCDEENWIGECSPEYIDLGGREKPWNRTDLRKNLNPGNQDWTVMLWYKWSGENLWYRDYQYIFNKGASFYSGASGAYAARFKNGTLEYRLGTGWDFIKNTSFYCPANEWCHLALTFDHKYERVYKNGGLVFERAAYHQGSGSYYYKEQMKQELLRRASADNGLTGIINGISIASGYGSDFLNAVLAECVNQGAGDKMLGLVQDMEYDLGSNTESLYIGEGAPDWWSYGFLGMVDEFAIFNKALTNEEIREKMSSEIIPDSSTQLLLHFNNQTEYGESESFVRDFSTNNYDGVPVYSHYSKYLWGTSHVRAGGMPAIHGGIVYRTIGVLYAHNETTGKILWQKGNFSTYERVFRNLTLGEVEHNTPEIVYSDGIVYSFGLEAVNYTSCNAGGQCFSSISMVKLIFLGYNSTTGEELLRIELNNTFPQSFAVENDVAYLRFSNSIRALDLVDKRVLWTYNFQGVDKPIQSLVLSGDLLFASIPKGILIALNKKTGEKAWEFIYPYNPVPYRSTSLYYFSGMIIENNMLFAGHYDGMVFALEQGYEKPRIMNNNTKLAAGQVNREYIIALGYSNVNYTFKHINGEMPFNWSISSGRLPEGLYIKNDRENYFGEMYGTPIESGDFAFTVRVTDKRGNYDEKEFSLRIIPDSKIFSAVMQNNENYSGCEDTAIDSWTSWQNNNYGNGGVLESKSGYGITEGYGIRGLMKFRIFQREGGLIPDDAILTGASLTFYKADSESHVVSAYQVLKNWTEMQATGVKANNIENWSQTGANHTGIDRTESLLNFTTSRKIFVGREFIDSSDAGSYSSDITPLVKGYDSGLENNGWMFTQPRDSGLLIYSCDYFNISEADNGASKRPKLTISYKRFNPENKAPVAKLYANPSIILSGQNVTLDASQSYDTDGNVATYEFPSLSCFPGSGNGLCKTSLSMPVHDMCRCCPNGGWACNQLKYTEWCPKYYDEFCPYKKYTSTLYVNVYDDYGVNAGGSVNVTILQSFTQTTITTTMLRNGRKNLAYSDYVYVAGNSSAVTWSLASGNLPDGLSLNTGTGEISGIPIQTGKFDFTIGVTGSYVEQNLSIEILDETGIPAECADDETRSCGAGVCSLMNETCLNNSWQGCSLDIIPGYEFIETSCSDGKDNDCNGKADCNDSSCSSAVECHIPCILTDARWNKTSAVINELVELQVVGSNCAGKEINYTIWKNIPVWFDKKIFQASSSASTTWNAGKKEDGSFETGNYYFIANLRDDASVSVNSKSFGNDLSVYECMKNSDCGILSCSRTYSDSCAGRKLADYNNNKLIDTLIKTNSCSNICSLNLCQNCTPDCSAVPSSSCVKGACDAECDASHICQATTCSNLSRCIGNDYYEYTDVSNSCLSDCTCERKSCTAVIRKNDPACTQCRSDADCSSLTRDYCSGNIAKHDKGACNSSYACMTETTIINNCSSKDKIYCSGTRIMYDNYTCSSAQCILQINLIEDCNDNLFCNGQETCRNAACIKGAFPVIDDRIGCTMDYCDEANDIIFHMENNSICDYCENCFRGWGCRFNLLDSGCLKLIENCTDKDEDGVLDYDAVYCPMGKDKCIQKRANLSSAELNSFIPKASLLNLSYDSGSSLKNVSDFKIYIGNVGEIIFKKKLDFSNLIRINDSGCFSSLLLDSLVEIKNSRVRIDSENFPELNQPAIITFYNITFKEPKIKKDGADCSDCRIVSYNASSQKLSIEVSGFSEYELVEGYVSAAPPGDGGGSGGSGGGGDGGGTSPQACIENWICWEWQSCIDGEQARICEDNNNCGTEINKPETQQNCGEEKAGASQPEITKAIKSMTIRLNMKIIIIVLIIVIISVLSAIFILIKIRKKSTEKLKEKAGLRA